MVPAIYLFRGERPPTETYVIVRPQRGEGVFIASGMLKEPGASSAFAGTEGDFDFAVTEAQARAKQWGLDTIYIRGLIST